LLNASVQRHEPRPLRLSIKFDQLDPQGNLGVQLQFNSDRQLSKTYLQLFGRFQRKRLKTHPEENSMNKVINPVASKAHIHTVLNTVRANAQAVLNSMDISYPLQQRLITSHLIWDDKRNRTIVIYRLMDKGRDWLNAHQAETVH